jgi:polar amino acid transport system substrate-binding protein
MKIFKSYLASFFPILGLLICLLSSCGDSPETRETYKVLIDSSWRHLDIQGKRININNALNEFLDHLEEENNILIQRIFSNYDEVIYQLDSKNCDAVLIGRNLSRPPFGLYDYSKPFILLGPVLVVPYEIQADSLDDMKNRLIGVQERSFGAKLLSTKHKIFSKHFEYIKLGLEETVKGELQGLILGNLAAEDYCSGLYKDTLHVVGDVLTDEGIRLFILKDGSEKNRTFLRKFNKTLNTFQSKGELTTLFEKWGIRKKVVKDED